MYSKRKPLFLLIASLSALAVAIPAIGQQSPESLLPEGFGDTPAPAPKPSESAPAPGPASSPNVPSSDARTPSTSSSGAASGSAVATKSPSSGAETGEEGDEELVRYDVPPAARRSLRRIGFVTPNDAGFPEDAFGDEQGSALVKILKNTDGPLVSRWGNIITRRLLASRTISPAGINAADWTAERAWLLLRLGESVAARQLVQQVDAGDYSERLYVVAMQAFLANADLAGFCPLADRATIVAKNEPTWKMARPICASLAAEQATATSLLRQNRNRQTMVGVDYLLSEKAMGAGTGGQRTVKIEWDKATGFNAWRFGLANATGVEPPQKYYDVSGRHVSGWRVLLPMLPVKSRIAAAYDAAAIGVLSNAAMADLFAQAYDDSDVGDAITNQSNLLATAFAADDAGERVAAMRSLWDGAGEGSKQHAMLVMTARAAAAVAPSSDVTGDADNLIRSMMTGGFDNSAAEWADVISEGSLGWGLLAVGAPGMDGEISYNQLDSFYDEDGSNGYLKSKMLLAGLAGLGRVGSEARADFSEELEVDLNKQSTWTQGISAAASRGDSGTVMLLAAVALQGNSWSKIPPHFLYNIVKALKETGRDAEARMIAAEAVSFS